MRRSWQSFTVAIALCVIVAGTVCARPKTIYKVDTDSDLFTPVTDILNDRVSEPNELPIANKVEPSTTSLDAIKSLEYHPPESTLEPFHDDTHPQITPAETIQSPIAAPQESLVPAMVIFPVVIHEARNKAFSDFPVMLSAEVATQFTQQFEKQNLGVTVLNPMYAYDQLQQKGLQALYGRVVKDYLEAAQPNEADLTQLVESLNTKTQHVDWVAFVQADVDTNHMAKPSLLEKPFNWLYDRNPLDPNYFLKGNVRIYSTQEGLPLVWKKSTDSVIKMGAFVNFSKSVYDAADSSFGFKNVADKMAVGLVAAVPPVTFSKQSSVQARVVADNPNFITRQLQQNVNKFSQQIP